MEEIIDLTVHVINQIDVVMVRVLVLSTVDLGFEPQSGKTED